MAPSPVLLLVLAALALLQPPREVGERVDGATRQRLQRRLQHLERDATRLQREPEREQPQPLVQQQQQQQQRRRGAAGRCGQLWEPLAALVLLGGHCWLARRQRRKAEPGERRSLVQHDGECEGRAAWAPQQPQEQQQPQQEQLQQQQQPQEQEQQQLLPHAAWSLPEPREALFELLGELLSACHVLSLGSCCPRVAPGVRVAARGGGRCLLVPLRAPPGHAFRVEAARGRARSPARGRVRVRLRCACARQRLLGDAPCALHPPPGARRAACPLRALCSRSCLDARKTARWFGRVLRRAWLLLPAARHCRLAVRAGARACRLRLAAASGRSLRLHVLLGVRQGRLGLFWPPGARGPPADAVRRCWSSALSRPPQ